MPSPADPPKVIVTLPQRVEIWHQPMRGDKIRLFSHEELQCPATKVVKLADGFTFALRDLRVAWGRPMKVNSCCRSEAHNKAIGGHPKSLHVYDFPVHPINGTAAIDIATPDNLARTNLHLLAWSMGWSIGHGRNFLHLDRRDLAGLPQRMFGY